MIRRETRKRQPRKLRRRHKRIMVNMVMMAQMMKSLVSRGPTRPRTVASSCMMVRWCYHFGGKWDNPFDLLSTVILSEIQLYLALNIYSQKNFNLELPIDALLRLLCHCQMRSTSWAAHPNMTYIKSRYCLEVRNIEVNNIPKQSLRRIMYSSW